MVSKRDGKLVLWPSYFDSREPRPWRRVARALAIHEPTAEEIAKAALALRLNPVLEKGVAHPKAWSKKTGRVLIDVRGSKTVLLVQIAERLRATRDAQPHTAATRPAHGRPRH
ncbi:MAG: signal recognition particle subunit SRP19/SEC65 family protein [Thermoplasmatota archaeon]